MSNHLNLLQGIYDADIAKLLGAQFNVDTLREIFAVLKSHFIHQNMPIANILSGIVKNMEMPIISVLMNEADLAGKLFLTPFDARLKNLPSINGSVCIFFFFRFV